MGKKAGLIARYRSAVSNQTFAGVVLLLAAVIALIWANSPIRDSYFTVADHVVGPSALKLDIPISQWAADGVLAIFFFVVGMELKQEFTIGALRDIRQALVPVLAAVFGMIGPVAVYVIINSIASNGNFDGWAVPVATDIAFALGVLGLFGKGLPPALRTFLMTLAVVDDLLGILVIAIFFSDNLNFIFLGLSILTIIIFGLLLRNGVTHWWVLWPVGIIAWYLMFSSGVHATISAVGLGLMVPAVVKTNTQPLTERFTEKLDFYSAGIILPIFAFFAAGVNVVDSGGFGEMLTDPVAAGIYLGLPVGKCLGITLGVIFMVKVLRLKLGGGLDFADVFAVSIVAGIGFTVSLLIATLSFDHGDPHGDHARVAVLLGTLISMIVGAIALRLRVAQHVRHDGGSHTLQEQSRRATGGKTKARAQAERNRQARRSMTKRKRRK